MVNGGFCRTPWGAEYTIGKERPIQRNCDVRDSDANGVCQTPWGAVYRYKDPRPDLPPCNAADVTEGEMCRTPWNQVYARTGQRPVQPACENISDVLYPSGECITPWQAKYQQGTARPPLPNTRALSLYATSGVDIPGNDIECQPTTLDTCRTKCSYDPNCKAYTITANQCCTKKAVGTPAFSAGTTAYTDVDVTPKNPAPQVATYNIPQVVKNNGQFELWNACRASGGHCGTPNIAPCAIACGL